MGVKSNEDCVALAALREDDLVDSTVRGYQADGRVRVVEEKFRLTDS